MTKKLTITVEDLIYERLYDKIGPRKIGKFLQELARPYLMNDNIEAGYKAMSQDLQREKDAEEWTKNTLLSSQV